MTTAADEGADAGRRRIPPAAIAAVVMVGAVVVLGLKNWFEERAETLARAEESRRESEQFAAMARDVAERERRRPAPASGVRLLPRTLVRVGDDRTYYVRTLGWSPDGERFAVIRQEHFGILGIERDVFRETVVIFDLDGKLLREVPLPPADRSRVWGQDTRFALTSAGHLVVKGGEACLFGLDGKETGRIGGGARGPIVGARADSLGRVLAWSAVAVVVPDEPGGHGTLVLNVGSPGKEEIRDLEASGTGKSAVVLTYKPGARGVDAWILDLESGRMTRTPTTGKVAAPSWTPDRVTWIPGSDRLLLVRLGGYMQPHGFDIAAPDGSVEASVAAVADAAALSDGSAIVGHGEDGALRLWGRDGRQIRSLPGVLDRSWYSPWWRGMPAALVAPPKGDFFATLRNIDGEYVRLWSAAGEPLARDPMPGTTLLAHFSPSGERILVGYASGLVAVLEIERAAAGK